MDGCTSNVPKMGGGRPAYGRKVDINLARAQTYGRPPKGVRSTDAWAYTVTTWLVTLNHYRRSHETVGHESDYLERRTLRREQSIQAWTGRTSRWLSVASLRY